MSPTIIGIIIAIVLAIYIVSKYNTLVALRNNREQSFADIDVQLKQRFDLIPQLVETVKGYAKHEKETLDAVITARNSFQNASGTDDKIAADNMITGALKSIFALSEAYPDLKANTNFLQLQTEMSDIENKLAAARRFFNNTTTEYNTVVQIFPNNIIASLFGFKRLPLFEAVESKEALNTAPNISF